MPESRQLLRAHAGLTARTLQNIVNDIDFGDLVGVSQPDAADFALPQQVIRRVAADAQHDLQILNRYNVRILRKHELVISLISLQSIRSPSLYQYFAFAYKRSIHIRYFAHERMSIEVTKNSFFDFSLALSCYGVLQ